MDGVFVWHWVQQHRVLSVIVLALFIVATAGGTAWALVFRTVSSPVGLAEALRMYRREQTAKVLDLAAQPPAHPRRLHLCHRRRRGAEPDGRPAVVPAVHLHGGDRRLVRQGQLGAHRAAHRGHHDLPGRLRRLRRAPAGDRRVHRRDHHDLVHLVPGHRLPVAARRRARAAMVGHLLAGQPGREGGSGRPGLRPGHPRRRGASPWPSSTSG